MLSDSAVEPNVTLTTGGSATERDKDGSSVLVGRLLRGLESVGLVSELEAEEDTLLSAAGSAQVATGAGLGEIVGCRVAVDDWGGSTGAVSMGM